MLFMLCVLYAAWALLQVRSGVGSADRGGNLLWRLVKVMLIQLTDFHPREKTESGTLIRQQ